MKMRHLAAFSVLLAVGCVPPASSESMSNTSSPDLSVSVPETGEGLTLVSMNIPGMT